MNTAPIILSIAYPFAPVGPAAVGGAEVVLSQLEAALPELGFRSVVVARAGSEPRGQLYPVEVPPGEITEETRAATQAAMQRAIDLALAEHPVALVHMHGMDFSRYILPPGRPVLVTLHLPLAWTPEGIWQLPSNYTFVCVSEAQRSTCPAAARHRTTVIENGVPIPDASTLRPGGRYALMLARICAEKNLATGLDAARLAGMPAVLAGEVFPYRDHQRYFAEEIEPRLTHQGSAHTQRPDRAGATAPDARFQGPVTGASKARLLARAACLLLPSLAPETSSLVAMEALAAGVPVIAMASGAVPEIVEDGQTGFLIPPGSGLAAAEAMAAAIRRLPELDRATCRARAVERFSLDRMLGQYAALWRALALHDARPSSAAPVARPHEDAEPRQEQLATYVEHLTADSTLEALLPEWTALWHEDPQASPFQHPAWLLPWWHQFGPEGNLWALAFRDISSRKLCAFLPLYTYLPAPPGDPARQLLLLGAGTSDYLDGLWSPAAPEAPATALKLALEASDVWEAANLPQCPASSPLRKAAQEVGVPIALSQPASIIDLAQPLPAKLRANAGRYRRRAEAISQLQLHVAGSADEALGYFDLLLAFHRTRWPGETGGVLADPRVQAHHREALPALLAAGLLRFFRLSLVADTLGVLYALADPASHADRRLSLYLIGFNGDLSAISPGTLLIHEVWQYARSHGFSKLDLLRGGEAYKDRWGAVTEPTYALTLPRFHNSGG